MHDKDKSKKIALDLLSIGAVFLRPDSPFTWASGIKSPIYTDNRLILTSPGVRDEVEEALADLIRERFPGAELLMGTATAGIAHAAIAAHILDLPMGYVRGGAKDHGRRNRIEGSLTPGEKCVVVEDLISTGGSVIETVDALAEAGAEVIGIVSIFSYRMKESEERLRARGLSHYSLTDLDALVCEAADEGYISAGDTDRILQFRDNPLDESWIK